MTVKIKPKKFSPLEAAGLKKPPPHTIVSLAKLRLDLISPHQMTVFDLMAKGNMPLVDFMLALMEALPNARVVVTKLDIQTYPTHGNKVEVSMDCRLTRGEE